jgi:hypothetical protein
MGRSPFSVLALLVLAACDEKPHFAVPSAPPAGAADSLVVVRYDRFTDTTDVLLRSVPLEARNPDTYVRPPTVLALFFVGGKSLGVPEYVRLTIETVSDPARYRECQRVALLADGHRVVPTETGYATDAVGSWAIERASVIISPADLVRVATAQSVELQLCGDELTMPTETQRLFRLLASRMAAP